MYIIRIFQRTFSEIQKIYLIKLIIAIFYECLEIQLEWILHMRHTTRGDWKQGAPRFHATFPLATQLEPLTRDAKNTVCNRNASILIGRYS